MPVKLSEEFDRIIVVRITGDLTKADFDDFRPQFENLVLCRGRLRVLFDMIRLTGWEPGAIWDEFKFDIGHYSDIDRMASVGDKMWEHGLIKLFRPFTHASIRCYGVAEMSQAKTWLNEPKPVLTPH